MLHIRLINNRQRTEFDHNSGPLEFGRAPSDDGQRVVVQDRYVSRCQLRVEQIAADRVRLENLGQTFTLPDGSVLNSGDARIVELPYRLQIGETSFAMTANEPVNERVPSLQTISQAPQSMQLDTPPISFAMLGASPSPETLTRWFETLLTVQRSAAGSDAFYDETARAVVNLVGLDCGMVIMRRDNAFHVRAFYAIPSANETSYSRSVIAQVLREKRTLYRSPDQTEAAASLATVESVVASPIFDQHREVVGAVYGTRGRGSATKRTGIAPLEAQLVQVLAGVVSVGLVRMEQEGNAARNRARFEQFFSAELATELERNPDLLEGTQREISVLFADVRGFSRISEILGARDIYRLVRNVMDRMTEPILAQQGVIIDYYGDGIAAMWNAPTDQPRHAELACRAAIAMQAEADKLSKVWQQTIGMPFRLGIGVNSGTAEVGNAGSSLRLKYGPRGHTVNVASRIEGATKAFHVPVLVTGPTRSGLGADFPTRRLCRLRVVGMEEGIELFELYCGTPDQTWTTRRDKYEQALTMYEERRCDDAAAILDQLTSHPGGQSDEPTQILSRRIVEMRQAPDAHDTIIQLQAK